MINFSRAFLGSLLLTISAVQCISQSAPTDHSQDVLRSEATEISDRAEQLLKAGKFQEAEPLVTQCLDRFPEELRFLAQLETTLNGESRFSLADEVRAKILKLWSEKYRAEWSAKGFPESGASWVRIRGETRDFQLSGSEYFEPKRLPIGLKVYYEVIAVPKLHFLSQRVLRVGKYPGELNYFLEEFGETSISLVAIYDEIPDIRTVMNQAVEYFRRNPVGR